MSIRFRLAHQDFELDCPAKDEATMRACIEQVERQIRGVRATGVSDNQRCVIIAAILIAFEAKKGDNKSSKKREKSSGLDSGTVKLLEKKIDAALSRTHYPAKV